MNRYTLTLISLVLLLASCEKTIVLDTRQVDSKVVVEGLITNYPGNYFIKLTRSTDFYSTGKTPRITNASVVVADDLGNSTLFVHNPNDHPDSAGYYKPTNDFIGVIGRTYKLTVTVDGKSYEAEDTMFPVTKLDSLKSQKNERQFEDPKIKGKYYEVLMYAREPHETRDYYKFNFYRNDTLALFSPSDIYFTDDIAIGEEINGVPSPVYYAVDDSAKVEAMSLSRKAFVFYSDLNNLINNDGGMYSPPPGNNRTNLSNDALGFFQASAVEIKGIRIKE